MADQKDDQERVHTFVDLGNLQGISFSTVKDGKLMFITKEMLKRLLDHLEAKGQDRTILFIKDPVPGKELS